MYGAKRRKVRRETLKRFLDLAVSATNIVLSAGRRDSYGSRNSFPGDCGNVKSPGNLWQKETTVLSNDNESESEIFQKSIPQESVASPEEIFVDDDPEFRTNDNESECEISQKNIPHESVASPEEISVYADTEVRANDNEAECEILQKSIPQESVASPEVIFVDADPEFRVNDNEAECKILEKSIPQESVASPEVLSVDDDLEFRANDNESECEIFQKIIPQESVASHEEISVDNDLEFRTNDNEPECGIFQKRIPQDSVASHEVLFVDANLEFRAKDYEAECEIFQKRIPQDSVASPEEISVYADTEFRANDNESECKIFQKRNPQDSVASHEVLLVDANLEFRADDYEAECEIFQKRIPQDSVASPEEISVYADTEFRANDNESEYEMLQKSILQESVASPEVIFVDDDLEFRTNDNDSQCEILQKRILQDSVASPEVIFVDDDLEFRAECVVGGLTKGPSNPESFSVATAAITSNKSATRDDDAFAVDEEAGHFISKKIFVKCSPHHSKSCDPVIKRTDHFDLSVGTLSKETSLPDSSSDYSVPANRQSYFPEESETKRTGSLRDGISKDASSKCSKRFIFKGTYTSKDKMEFNSKRTCLVDNVVKRAGKELEDDISRDQPAKVSSIEEPEDTDEDEQQRRKLFDEPEVCDYDEKPDGCGTSSYDTVPSILQNDSASQEHHECTLCCEVFQDIVLLKKHERSHSYRKFECVVCDKTFNSSSHLKQHVKTHTDERNFKCDLCPSAFYEARYLRYHMKKVHKTLKVHTSGKLKQSFETKRNPGKHNRTHKRQSSLNSVTIQTNNDASTELTMDKNNTGTEQIRTEQSKFKCVVCGKTCKRLSHLREHVKTHTGERNFKCNQCTAAFYEPRFLRYHVNRVHKKPKTYKSGKLKQSFVTKDKLKKNNRTHEGQSSFNSVTIQNCNDDLTEVIMDKTKTGTEQICSGQRKFKCVVCNKSFKNSSHLNEHMQIHTGEKNFKCDLCPAAFYQPRFLGYHVEKVHKTLKIPRNVNLLEQSFQTKHELGKNNGTHKRQSCLNAVTNQTKSVDPTEGTKNNTGSEQICTEEFKFKCVVCNKKFNRLSRFNEHVKTHTGEKNFKCGLCSAAYYEPRHLRYHWKRVHKTLKTYKSGKLKQSFVTKHKRRKHNRTHKRQSSFNSVTNQTSNDDLIEVTTDKTKTGTEQICSRQHKFKCVVCDRTFKKSFHLREHVKTHTGEKNFKCDLCTAAFYEARYLRYHKEKVHKKLKIPKSVKFEQSFLAKHELGKYNGTHKRQSCLNSVTIQTNSVDPTEVTKNNTGSEQICTEQRKLKCVVCDKKFKWLSRFNEHVKTHTGEKNFKCDLCTAAYYEPRHLIYHEEKVHKTLKVHTSGKLNQSILTKYKVTKHNRTHKRQSSFNSVTIQTSNDDLSEVTKDMTKIGTEQICSGQHKFKCVVCDRTFKQSCHLREHVKTHTGEKNFKCDLCTAAFYEARYLRYHKEKVHKTLKVHTNWKLNQSILTKYKVTKHNRTHKRQSSFKSVTIQTSDDDLTEVTMDETCTGTEQICTGQQPRSKIETFASIYASAESFMAHNRSSS